MPRRASSVVACVLGLAALSASSAAASTITYQCGNEVCGIDPDGGAVRTLTSGGSAAEPNSGGTISRDGQLLSWRHAGTILVAPPTGGPPVGVAGGTSVGTGLRMAPTGNAWTWHQQIPTGGFPADYTYLLRPGSEATSVAVNADTSGWLGAEPIGAYHVDDKLPETPPSQVCVLDNSPARCPRLVASDPTRLLAFPDGSPDGSLVAAAAEPETGATQTFGGSIALYTVATGALLRDLTSGTNDSIPAFSPDGSRVAFQRDGGVWVVPVTGGPARRLVTGFNPSWGGPPASASGGGAAPRATASAVRCRRRTGRCVLRGTATGATRVEVAVQRRRGSRCEAWTGRRWTSAACSSTRPLTARLAKGRWTLTVRGLRTGSLKLVVRARGTGGTVQATPARRTVLVR